MQERYQNCLIDNITFECIEREIAPNFRVVWIIDICLVKSDIRLLVIINEIISFAESQPCQRTFFIFAESSGQNWNAFIEFRFLQVEVAQSEVEIESAILILLKN